MDAFYRLLLQSVIILPGAFAATGIADPWMKCTPKVGQKCKTFGGAFFTPKKSFAKNNTNSVFVSGFVLFAYGGTTVCYGEQKIY